METIYVLIEDIGYTYNRVLVIKKDEILLLATTWWIWCAFYTK